jgi:hypothetical protein
VSGAAVEALRQRIRAITQEFQHSLAVLETHASLRTGVSAEALRGTGVHEALEAHVRQYVIDPLLVALGWKLGSPETLQVEDPVDAGSEQERRRFLDYHGRSSASGQSLLVIEAKRPRENLPPASRAEMPAAFCDAITRFHTGKRSSKVSQAWNDWIASLIDYATRAGKQTGRVPFRVAITNGEWLVVFRDVSHTLLAPTPDSDGILVFHDLTDLEARAAELFTLLSYQSVSGHIPPQPPAAIREFVAEGETADCVRTMTLSYSQHGWRQPLLSVSVGAFVKASSGTWVLFSKNYDVPFLLLSHDPQRLAADHSAVLARSDELLSDLKLHRAINLISPSEFEQACSNSQPHGDVSYLPSSRLVSRLVGPDERYRVVGGGAALYFVLDSEYDSCNFHLWGESRKSGNAVGERAVLAPSTEPRSYFPSGSHFHCAHGSVHELRKDKCLLQPFESFLCCRRCVFLKRCWPNADDILPCKKS